MHREALRKLGNTKRGRKELGRISVSFLWVSKQAVYSVVIICSYGLKMIQWQRVSRNLGSGKLQIKPSGPSSQKKPRLKSLTYLTQKQCYFCDVLWHPASARELTKEVCRTQKAGCPAWLAPLSWLVSTSVLSYHL